MLNSIWYRGSYASYLYPQADLSEEGRAGIREELKSSENPRILPSITASLRSFIRNRRESPGTLFSMLRGVKARVGKSAIRPGAVSDDARKALEKFGMTIPLQVKIRGDQLIPIFGEVNSK